MTNIIEWMIEQKIATNGFQAAHISEGLQLPLCNRAEQEKRCQLYRKARAKTDKKNDIPAWQAYEIARAGIDVTQFEFRQIDLFEVVNG